MSQVGIREYDAKKMRSSFSNNNYQSLLVTQEESLNTLASSLKEMNPDGAWVVKPDQLFGKRGKYGLVGVKLSAEEVETWIKERWQREVNIGGIIGTLNAFLVEPFVAHDDEFYVSFETHRDIDRINFSLAGGVEVEENWENVVSIDVGVCDELYSEKLEILLAGVEKDIDKTVLSSFVRQLFSFFRSHGMSYLECNPFTIVDGEIAVLDMVAKVDNCEAWKQKKQWKNIHRVKPFGSVTDPFEAIIEACDAETGASLKFTTLNPQGRIALLLAGGGASVVTMDKLTALGLVDQTINYGEISGNPSFDHNKVYIHGLIDLLCRDNQKKDRSADKKYLCYFGGIANFTRVDILCQAFVKALEERLDDIKKHQISLLIRRGGVRDTEGLEMVRQFCEQHELAYDIYDADVYLTDAIAKLR